MTISTLVPVPCDEVAATAQAARPASLAGRRVGVMYNAKPNALELLGAIADLLRDEAAMTVVTPPVRTEGVFLPSAQQLTDLASDADFVLIGLGDCGSCSACSIQVATDFERKGVPAAAICTTPFLKAGQAMAARQGIPGYDFVTVSHPLSSLTLDELRERALEALPQVLAAFGAAADVAQWDRRLAAQHAVQA